MTQIDGYEVSIILGDDCLTLRIGLIPKGRIRKEIAIPYADIKRVDVHGRFVKHLTIDTLSGAHYDYELKGKKATVAKEAMQARLRP